jgi:hypothetical protein
MHEQARAAVPSGRAVRSTLERDDDQPLRCVLERLGDDDSLLVAQVETGEKGLLCGDEIGYRLPREK